MHRSSYSVASRARLAISRLRLCIYFSLLSLVAGSVHAQSSLASRVLVVYVSNDSNSSSIASHYQSKRGVPAANMCPVTLPNPAALQLNASDYNTLVKTPVQNCLNAVGPAQILYIVLAYIRPFAVYPTSNVYDYALDSFLADIWDQYTTQDFYPEPTKTHPYYVENQSQGDVYVPFQSLAAYRTLGLPLIYSVWRLDGVTPALATALVDNAMAAEAAGGPISQTPNTNANACIDMLLNPTIYPDTGYQAGDWDLYRAAQFLSATNTFNVVTDTNTASFGTAPAPATCPNTALYAGWYNYDTYNNVFSWDAGSIGWDLDSVELYEPRSGPYWGTNALENGLTVNSGAMGEPYLEGIARPGGVMRNLLEGANVGDAFLRNTRWLKWKILNVGDPLYTPFLNKVPPFNAPVAANSLSFNPRDLVGGGTLVAGIVNVQSAAPSGGLTVNLASSSSAFSVPASVTVPAGATNVPFLGTTSVVGQSTDIVVTASTSSMSLGNAVTLYPLLDGVDFNQNPVQGGQTVQALVLLNASAPMSGVTVQLSSDQPSVASVPPSVAVPAGLSQASFAVTLSTVSANTTVNITSTYAGAAPVTQLTVTP